MIKSMTGFGRERVDCEGREIIVEVKSVNHRYFEFTTKTPKAYGYLDEKLKNLASEYISRGKTEISVIINNQEGVNAEIEVNKSVAEGYIKALRDVKDELGLADDLTLSKIMRLPDIFNVVKQTEDEQEVWNCVKNVAESALKKFVEMRTAEGEKMYEDISGRLDYLENAVGEIEKLSPESVKKYQQKLYDKIKETLENLGTEPDMQRVVTETAVFADKVAVDEETVRLRSHISQFRKLIKEEFPVGRKLDFLVQEMNREVNTIGSKAQELEITKKVVDMKSEIEKIREQIQNIE